MHLKSWDLALEEWAARWNAAWPPESVLLAEQPDRVVLCNKSDAPVPETDTASCAGDWTRGHLFTEDWYVRWHRLGGSVRVAVFGEPEAFAEASLADPHSMLDLSEAERDERSVALWGAKQDGEDLWLELRVPHVMRLPDLHPAQEQAPSEAARRFLSAVVYRAADTRRVLAQRLTGIRYATLDKDGTVAQSP